MSTKKKNNDALIFFISGIALLLITILSLSVFPVSAQDLLFDEQIRAYAVTRFQDGFTEYEVRLTWSALEGADEYRIYKSINEGEFEEISTDDYEDEGFQLWWTDDDILEGYTYSYYVEGYFQDESVGRTDTVDVNFWLPSCPAEYPVNNVIIDEENPEFKWESIAINAFPFRNVIFSAEGEFILYDLTDDKEIRRTEIEDININSIRLIQEEETTETTDEAAIDTEAQIETDNELDSMIDVETESELDVDPDITSDDAPDNENNNEPLLIKKHQYQWQFKVIGYNIDNQATAESVTGGVFRFQEEVEDIIPEEEEDVEGGLNLDADFLSYQVIDEEDVIVAQDNVNLRYEDIVLKSNYLQIIIDKNELIAKDQVVFTKGEETYSCQALSYNWDTDKIIMDELSGETTGEKIKGKVYYQGEKLENFPDTIDIKGGFFTTCDLEEPHWHILAEQITIYPDDKIIAKKVSWYEGKKKIFTLPSFMIFLRGKNQFPYLPDIGQSSSEGWFFKNQFNYVEDETSYGSIYLDWMQKKGLGTGIEHTFELGEKRIDEGELVLYFYGLKRKNTSIYDLDAKIDYWQNFENDLRLRANLVYNGTVYPDLSSQSSTHILKPDFYLYKKFEDALLKLTGKYNFNISDIVTSSGNIKLSYDSTLTDRIKSNFNFLYTSQDSGDQSVDHQLRPEWLLRYSGDGYTLSLITEKQIDLNEGILAGGGNPKTLDKLPELSLKKSNAKIKNTDINYSIDASVGRYYEGATDQENVRGEYIINVNRPFKITDNISLTASGIYRQDVYLTGEARYQLGGKLDLKVGYRPEFYGTFSYNYYMSEGPTPFNFDALSPLTESASANIVLKPRENLQVNLSTNYNFVSESFGNLGTKIKWEPKEGNEINLSTNFDLNNMEWNKRINTKMSLKFSDKWKMTYSGSVYFDDFDIRNSVISVVRDLHCREISINYKQSTQSIWLDFKIKAFPTESITIGG
ncbi:MAG TPA: hypothetical protein VJ958_03660 [Atribacterota bacterium]|nr:hypothetical protein [Atribacterota bacterium]